MFFYIANFYKNIKYLIFFVVFLLKNDKFISNKYAKRKNIAILVTRWPVLTVIYFNIAIAILIKFFGYRPVIIYDDLTSDIFKKNFFVRFTIYLLFKILKDVKIVYLSKLTGLELDDSDIYEIKILSKLNTYYKQKTTVIGENFTRIYNDFIDGLSFVSHRINRLFSDNKFAVLIIPGGVYGHTGLYIHFGNKYNVRVAAYDSGPNRFIVGTDNVAGYLKDIPKILGVATNLDEFKNEIALAKQEFEKRTQGKDSRRYQPLPFDLADNSLEQFDVVVPLNIEIDTASLVKSSNFENMCAWLTETIDFLLKNTMANVVIKEHPSIYNRTDFLKRNIISCLAGNPRVQYFSRDDKVNTYQLINKAKIVLPYTSTVGIEAAIMGRAVIVESGVYYSSLPFVINSSSKRGYFDNILKYLENGIKLSDDEKKLALLCYYFTQKCNFLNTYFTPQPVDFNVWSKMSISELFNDEKIKIILTSFIDGIPLAKLNHEYLISKQNVN